MKRTGIIILAIVLLVLGTGAGLAYYYVVRPAMGTINAARDLARIQEIERRVENRAQYSAPASGELNQSQVERYVSASRSIRAGLENRLGQLEARYQQVEDQGRNPNLRELAAAYADILRLVVEAKELQVEALNDTGFSLSEYAWVRGQVLRAAGFQTVQVDLSALAEESNNAVRELQASVPEVNVALVQGYVDELEEALPLAAFGL
jgi:hypothetical protein